MHRDWIPYAVAAAVAITGAMGLWFFAMDEEARTMSKLYAALLVAIALMGMAAIGTLALVVITDAGNLAYPTLRPGMNP
jgi:hypothetical protein